MNDVNVFDTSSGTTNFVEPDEVSTDTTDEVTELLESEESTTETVVEVVEYDDTELLESIYYLRVEILFCFALVCGYRFVRSVLGKR